MAMPISTFKYIWFYINHIYQTHQIICTKCIKMSIIPSKIIIIPSKSMESDTHNSIQITYKSYIHMYNHPYLILDVTGHIAMPISTFKYIWYHINHIYQMHEIIYTKCIKMSIIPSKIIIIPSKSMKSDIPNHIKSYIIIMLSYVITYNSYIIIRCKHDILPCHHV